MAVFPIAERAGRRRHLYTLNSIKYISIGDMGDVGGYQAALCSPPGPDSDGDTTEEFPLSGECARYPRRRNIYRPDRPRKLNVKL